MNGKLVAFVVISIVAGIGVGLGLSGAISQPNVSQILQLHSEVSNLRSELSTLRTDFADLNTTHSELQENYTLLTETLGLCFMKMHAVSMEPTLKVNDTVIVMRVENACDIEVGDIIVFHEPDDGDLIIHRAIQKISNNGSCSFKTKGDAVLYRDHWTVKESDIVGKVVAIIPQST